ncbi:MAG: hypothetical protein FJX57_20085 [Alphaproteobacteria bacterium]|nr:hypothetical protein [Alphaproteobacteria bacterium]
MTPLGPERLVAIDGTIDPDALAPRVVLRLGEREWLVLDAVAALLPPLPAALAIDVGDSCEGWRLHGPAARATVEKACMLDLETLPPGSATRTAMAGVTVMLRVVGPDAFELRVDRSYAAWLEAWLRQL